jgi:hypothetical protein
LRKQCIHGIVSGLQVNYAKSAATLIRCDLEEAAAHSTGAQVPYRGYANYLPWHTAHVRRLTAVQLQPLVGKVADALPDGKHG